MGSDLTTAIVVGAVVGLFFVALGHAQLVWLARRRRARESGARAAGSSPARTLLAWTAALLAALCFLRAATGRDLPDRPGALAAEGLLSVRARPGLVARHETRDAEVKRGQALVRFAGQDGVEAREVLRQRRQQVASQLASERTRPLDLDAETVRRADAARWALRDHEQRLKQLASERDAIQREAAAQALQLETRRFRLEQEDRDAAGELTPLAESLETERASLRSQELLFREGVVSALDAARARDVLARQEERVRQLADRRALLSRERHGLASLRAAAEATVARQLGERAGELAAVTAQVETARAALSDAEAALDLDRPRARTERRARLAALETDLADLDALLDGKGPPLVVQAPWDGRIGFRDPAPGGVPADGGPLLVAYRPGAIAVSVRLEPGEAEAAAGSLRASVWIPGAADGSGRTETLLPCAVLERSTLPDGATALRVGCDPPDRVVRQLAMGGAVSVVAKLSRGLASTRSFAVGLALAALAAGLVLHGSLRGRSRQRPPPGFPGGRTGPRPGGAGRPPPPVQVWPSPPPLPAAAAALDVAGPERAAGAPREV